MCCNVCNMAVVTISIKIYSLNVIQTTSRDLIVNVGRFLLSPRGIRKQCLLFRPFPSFCSLVSGADLVELILTKLHVEDLVSYKT
jgi:hypothetical protein